MRGKRHVLLFVLVLFSSLIGVVAAPRPAFAEEDVQACIGLTALEAKAAAEAQGLEPKFISSDDKDVTEAFSAKGGDPELSKSKVTAASVSWHLFWADTANLVLDFSVEGRLLGCVGKSAEDGAAVAGFYQYEAGFRSLSDVDVTKEVVGDAAIEEAKSAIVKEVEFGERFFGGKWVKYSLDYESRELGPAPKYEKLKLGKKAELRHVTITAGKKVKVVGNGSYVRVPVKLAARTNVTIRYDDFDAYKDSFCHRKREKKKYAKDEIDNKVKLRAGETVKTVVYAPWGEKFSFSSDEGTASWIIDPPKGVVDVNAKSYRKQLPNTRVRIEARFSDLKPTIEYYGPASLMLRWGSYDQGDECTIRCRITDAQYEQLKEANDTIVSDEQWGIGNAVRTRINGARVEGRLYSIWYEYEDGYGVSGPCLDQVEVLDVW